MSVSPVRVPLGEHFFDSGPGSYDCPGYVRFGPTFSVGEGGKDPNFSETLGARGPLAVHGSGLLPSVGRRQVGLQTGI